MKRWFACGIVVSVLVATAQQSANSAAFEVASVKAAGDEMALPPFVTGASEARMRFQGGPGTKSPERIDYAGVTLKMLVQRAYGLMPEQVVRPDWLATQRYTIQAKLPPGTTLEQSRLMLQNLLSDRFHLRLHREIRSFRVYHLIVSKNGPKLKPAEVPRMIGDKQEQQKVTRKDLAAARALCQSLGVQAADCFHLSRSTMTDFVATLSQHLDRPVIDRTQLEELYSFSLVWVPDGARRGDDVLQGPSIFAALEEQLGLELKSASEPLPVLVIDAAEKTPAGN